MQSTPSSLNNGKFDLIVSIKYKGIKATTYFSKFTPESEEVLRRDLATLRIPLPKVGNVVFLSHGSLQFFWPDLRRDNILKKHVMGRIHPHDVESQLEVEALFEELSILSMSMQPNHSEHKVPRPKSKRPYPFTSATETSNAFSEAEPYPDSHQSIHQVLHPKYRRPFPFVAGPPATETQNASSEAERFLDDIKSSLPPPAKRVKLEPVELTISDSNNFNPPVAKAPPTKPALTRRRFPVPNRPSDVPANHTSPMSPATGLAPQPYANTTLPANTLPNKPSIDYIKTPNEKASTQLLVQAQAIAAAFPPTSIPRLTTHAPSQAETPARSAKYQSVPHSGKTDLNVDSKPIISPSISRLSNTTRSSIDATTIQQLTKELGQLKQQWNVGISRENEIIADLRRLQSAFIPEPSRLVTSNEETILKVRLEQVEAELKTERRLRQEAEKTLEDVRKECASPFIVPALFDAFKAMSKLTSKVSVLHSES